MGSDFKVVKLVVKLVVKCQLEILKTLKSEPISELARCFGNTRMNNEGIGAAGIEIMLKR